MVFHSPCQLGCQTSSKICILPAFKRLVPEIKEMRAQAPALSEHPAAQNEGPKWPLCINTCATKRHANLVLPEVPP